MISNLDTASNSNFYGASNNPYVPASRVNSPVNSPTFNAPPLANSMHYPNLSQINFRPSATTPIRNSFSRTSTGSYHSSPRRLPANRNVFNERVRNMFLNQFISYLVFVLLAFYFLYDILKNGAFSNKDTPASGRSLFKIGFVLLLSILTKPINFN